MKKELTELLASESARLVLNNFFCLYRWQGKQAFTGLNMDGLNLEMQNVSGKLAAGSRAIKAREWQEVMNETAAAMTEMMKEYGENLANEFKAGHFGTR